LNFKPSGIKKYDGSTNPTEWLEVYQPSIEAAGGDSYVMANYLPVCVIIRHDLVPRTSCGVDSFLEPVVPAIHQ
jgi:hypothetical protein